MPKFDPNQQYSPVTFDPNASYDSAEVAPSVDLSNKQGEGTYQMADKTGQKVAVPYGQVQQANSLGYQFASDQDKFRYAKDNAADPNRQGGTQMSMQSAPGQTPVTSSAMDAYAGAMKGAATMERPVVDALGAATGLKQQAIDESLKPQNAAEAMGKYGAMGTAIVPAVVAAPVAAAGGVLAGTAGGAAGTALGNATGMTPEHTALLSDAAGLAAGAAGAYGANAAAPGVAAKISPTAIKESAAGLLQSVAHDANQIPVKLDNAGDAALNLMDWQKKTQLGPTINKFLNRITNPKLGPMNYEEARDYYQLLGKLSVDEANKLAPPVRRDLVQMVVGLKQDIGNAADQVGKAADYYKGLGDYAKGSKLQDWYDTAQDWAKKAVVSGALTAGGAGGLYSLWKAYQK